LNNWRRRFVKPLDSLLLDSYCKTKELITKNYDEVYESRTTTLKETGEELRWLNVSYHFLLQAIQGSKRVSIGETTTKGVEHLYYTRC